MTFGGKQMKRQNPKNSSALILIGLSRNATQDGSTIHIIIMRMLWTLQEACENQEVS